MSELQEKARTEYGIVNADQMSDEQLKAEMKAIDGTAKEESNEKLTGASRKPRAKKEDLGKNELDK